MGNPDIKTGPVNAWTVYTKAIKENVWVWISSLGKMCKGTVCTFKANYSSSYPLTLLVSSIFKCIAWRPVFVLFLLLIYGIFWTYLFKELRRKFLSWVGLKVASHFVEGHLQIETSSARPFLSSFNSMLIFVFLFCNLTHGVESNLWIRKEMKNAIYNICSYFIFQKIL